MTYVLQCWTTCMVIWCDYLEFESEHAAQWMKSRVEVAETKITGPNRRQWRIITRTV